IARTGHAPIRLSGVGTFGDRTRWDLKLGGRDIPADDELLKAIPESLASVLKSIALHGKIGVDFTRLVYRTDSNKPDLASTSTTRSGEWTHAGVSIHSEPIAVASPSNLSSGATDLTVPR